MTAGDVAAALRRDLADKPEWLHRIGAIVQSDGSLRFVVGDSIRTFGRTLWGQREALIQYIDNIAARYQTTVVAVDYAGDVLYRHFWVDGKEMRS